MSASRKLLLCFVVCATVTAFRWIQSAGLWKGATKMEMRGGTTYFLSREANRENEEAFTFYESQFASPVDVSGETCIVQSRLKQRDSHGRTRIINPLAFEAVDLDKVLQVAKSALKDIVLMVDEADKCQSAMSAVYPNETYPYDYAGLLQRAMLSSRLLQESGIRSALIIATVDPACAVRQTMDRRSYKLPLSENLNATAVTQNLFLADLDPDGSMHAVTPYLSSKDTAYRNNKNGTDVAFEWLRQLAAYYAHSPRALEFAQDYLRCRVDRNTAPRSLIVTSSLVEGLFEYVEEQLKLANPALYKSGVPEAEVLIGALWDIVVPLSGKVIDGIHYSLFTHSCRLLKHEGNNFSYPCQIEGEVRTSLASLNAAVSGSEKVNIPGTVERCIQSLCMIYRNYVITFPRASRSRTLSDLSVAWLQLLLKAIAQANPEIYTSVSIMLRLRSLAPPGKRLERLKQVMPVPSYMNSYLTLLRTGVVPIHTMQHSFNTTTATTNSTNTTCTGALSTAVMDELNSIQLTAEVPCVILRAADGDCWGYGLTYLDCAAGDKTRVIFIESELDETDYESRVPCIEKHKLVLKVAAAYNQSRSTTDDTGAGDAVAAGNFLYISHSTLEGDATDDGTENCSFVTIPNEDVKDFYGMLYAPYLTVKEGNS